LSKSVALRRNSWLFALAAAAFNAAAITAADTCCCGCELFWLLLLFCSELN